MKSGDEQKRKHTVDTEAVLTVSERLLEAPDKRLKDLEVADVRLGLGYTAVQVGDGSVGTALTMGKEGARGATSLKGGGPWPEGLQESF